VKKTGIAKHPDERGYKKQGDTLYQGNRTEHKLKPAECES